MSKKSRTRKRQRAGEALDGLDTVGTLFDLGPVGFAIALVGGAIAVVAGVFSFMNRRS